MSPRPAVCLLLFCISFPLMAQEARRLGPNGGGACMDMPAHTDEDHAPATPVVAAKPAPVRKVGKTKPVVPRENGDMGDVRPPRWHSFLPGMFR
ncbi:hypothetical protein [Luteimonas aquatica]|uniref:hypothetical protein n=1 Tax=Luteimonas aquatica TaxID=450364 RepID=UPI001F59C89D|nr:hypothetical protein [Luteimonas aquatica]